MTTKRHSPGWYGESLRHYFAQQGITAIKRKPRTTFDLRGLEKLVDGCVADGVPKSTSGLTNEFGVKFDKEGFELVVDATQYLDEASSVSRFQKRVRNARQLDAAIRSSPHYMLGFDEAGNAYVLAGRGGTFVHPNKYRDNHYLEPIAYLDGQDGQSIVFDKSRIVHASVIEPDNRKVTEVLFPIKAIIGLETQVKTEVPVHKPVHLATLGVMGQINYSH